MEFTIKILRVIKSKPIFHLLAMTVLTAALGMIVYRTTDNGSFFISSLLFLIGTAVGFASVYMILKLIAKK